MFKCLALKIHMVHHSSPDSRCNNTGGKIFDSSDNLSQC